MIHDQELTMKKPYFGAATALLLVSTASAALAQYSGPGARKDAAPTVAHTVAEVLKDVVDDRPVELRGTLVQQIGRETFLFRDATGEIQVEIDAEDFPAGQPIAADTPVVISGEVDARTLRKPEIDVESVRAAAPAP
ncbi:MAG: NirD/YgiW/YdeI family stress tolerance protein [Steroidobacteraceae bacterium]